MIEMPTNQFVEIRNQGYYLAGSRISLDSVAYALKRGETVEEILADFPVIENRQRLEGAIAFIKAHPVEVDAYLAEKAERWEELRKQNPPPPELLERIRRYRESKGLKSA
ncbi:conserved hypothetical protein [Candidatus Sulfopaludibacter sp. SbA4]|nr:conserved hypothetical protein [Candidatus Sulfopaludibacter sp. SbA4]